MQASLWSSTEHPTMRSVKEENDTSRVLVDLSSLNAMSKMRTFDLFFRSYFQCVLSCLTMQFKKSSHSSRMRLNQKIPVGLTQHASH